MFDRKHVGHRFDPYQVEVERGAIRSFAVAIGETNPINTDEAAARMAGYRSTVAPLTFLASVVAQCPNSFPVAGLLGFSEEHVLHSGQSYEYFDDICAGDLLVLEEKVADIYDKKDGALNFVITETEVRNQDRALVAVTRETLVVRGA